MSGVFSELIGNPIGEAAAFAAGLAIHPLLKPLLQEEQNATWSLYRSLPLDPDKAAQLVAEGHLAADLGAAEAGLSGVSTDRFAKLALLAETFPGLATALTLQRRDQLPPGELTVLLNRLGFNADYQPRLATLVQNPIDPAVIAVAIQRSIMTPPFALPVAPPTATGLVPAFTISTLDAETEAAWSGVSLERLRILNAIVGLPASPDLAARMAFRGIIEKADYDRAIAEGNTRNEWRDFLFDGFREILTAHDYAELRLRGWLTTDQEMYDGTAKHGMSEADTDLLFKMLGRPLSVHQVVTGEARGGTYNGPTDGIPVARLKSMQESNVRPEYYNLDDANRYSYPSAFFFRLLLTTGALTADEGYQRFLEIGWPPDLARLVADALAVTTTGVKESPYVAKADTQLWTALHKSYVKTGTDRATVESAMMVLVDSAADREVIFERWDTEKTIDQPPTGA